MNLELLTVEIDLTIIKYLNKKTTKHVPILKWSIFSNLNEIADSCNKLRGN